jgi:hypothetical protein
LQQTRARRLSYLIQSGVEHDFSQGLVLFYEAVGRGRFLQWHDAVYEDFELSRPPQLESPLEVLLALCPEAAFHLQSLLVEAPHIQSDQPAAVRPSGDKPTASGEAVKGARPQSRVGDILEDHVNAVAPGQAYDLPCEILAAVVDPEVGPQGHGSLDPYVCTSASDDLGPKGFGYLHQATAEATGGAHDQDPVPLFEVGQSTLPKGEREMPGDHRPVSEGQPIGQRDTVAGRDPQIFRIATPALHSKHSRAHTASRVACHTWLAAPTAYAPEDDDAIVDAWLLDALANFDDDPRRTVAQDEGQGHAVVAAIPSYLYVQRAIDSYLADRLDHVDENAIRYALSA